MDIKEIEILGSNIAHHWYYRSKAKAMTRLIATINPSTILDVGAGSGFFSRYLLATSSAQEAWCVDISYSENSDAQEMGKPVHFRLSVEMVNADLVLLMDVLEHVEDDVGLLMDYASKVPSGTRFLISVPAFQFLWSGHDVFLEHKRRYQLNQIENVIEKAGLKVTCGVYYFGAVFPIAASIRLINNYFRKGTQNSKSQLKQHHPFVNGILAALSHTELPFMMSNRIFGLSAFCLAEKP